jgi:hypothetical protein
MFQPLAPEEIPNLRESRRGRISYPIMKSFMESNEKAVQFNPPPTIKQSKSGLAALLKFYVNRHELPIEVIFRGGKLYLVRTDVDDNGEFDPNWKFQRKTREDGDSITPPQAPMTPSEALRHVQEGAIKD